MISKQPLYFGGKGIATLIILILFWCGKNYSQQLSDSILLKEVAIEYFSEQPSLMMPSSVSIIDTAVLAMQNDQSLVAAMNTAAGVRMEERSPGSYRLSIRGSLLRSPFGVRNVKVYLDEFPFTDAGGNTYLNLLDMRLIRKIEILKGPNGGLFGANSGGVIRIGIKDDAVADSSEISVGFNGGSFDTYHQFARIKYKTKNNTLLVNEAWQQSNGYRNNSETKKQCLQLLNNWNYSTASQLRFLFFYSNLNYQTPGGLTLTQFNESPRAARPATNVLPGAAEQRAGVHNSTIYTGVLNESPLNSRIRLTTMLFGFHTAFENPFITNYEVRNENGLGVRTWIEMKDESDRSLKWIWNVGAEMQEMGSHITNYGNLFGVKDTVQSDVYFEVFSGFVFTRFMFELNKRFRTEASFNYNLNNYIYNDLSLSIYSPSHLNEFKPQLMPRLAVSYAINSEMAWRALVSKGYSAPTLSEVFSSTGIFNRSLQPESGYNYETGLRFQGKHSRVLLDVAAFYYHLQHAIVRRSDDAGAEFFINAGSTRQRGIESEAIVNIIQPRNNGFIRQLQVRQSYTFNHFVFGNYSVEANDYSSNNLTGVPKNVIVSGVTTYFPSRIFFFVQHNYTSSVPVNDANSEYAAPYHLLQVKSGWKYSGKRKIVLELYLGADNILNIQYSLGHDLNAAGGRYYNAAPPRNYYTGATITFN